jgi:hypothetical protein
MIRSVKQHELGLSRTIESGSNANQDLDSPSNTNNLTLENAPAPFSGISVEYYTFN